MRSHLSLRSIRRLPVLWWSSVGLLALLVGFTVTTTVSRAEASAARYGDTVRVAVATRDLEAGTELTHEDFHFESRPKALLPASPPAEVTAGAVVTTDTVEGEALVEAKLGTNGLGPIAAQLAPNERAVAFEREHTTIEVRTGDHIDVIGSFDSEVSGESTALVLASNCRVVAVNAESVTVAIVATEAPRVALAASKGQTALTLSPGSAM